MDEKKSTSSWDDLLKQVGAAPPPDALERKRPAIETTFEPPPEAIVPAVKPKPGDWNALASELGLEVREEQARKAEERPAPGPSSKSLEASLAEIEPMASSFEAFVEDEMSDVEFEEGERGDEGGSAPSAPAVDASALSGEAARSAFESLFEAGSFAALPPLKKPAPREPERKRQGPQWRDPDAPRQVEPEDEIKFEEIDEFGNVVDERGEQTEEGEEQRPRRRRRRRRGRGRESARGGAGEERDSARDELDEEQSLTRDAEDESEEGDEGEAAGDEGDRPPRRRRRRRRGGRARDDEEPTRSRADVNGESGRADDEDDEDDAEGAHAAASDDEDDDGEDSPRDSHKNIPTWSEAISVMVETNLQSRRNAPSRPSGPRERGRGGRGRGRGGSGGRRGKA
jgi:ribonuclease E